MFQDIRPVKAPPKPIIKKITKLQKARIAFLSLFDLPIHKKLKQKISQIPKKTLVTSTIILAIITISVGCYLLIPRAPKISSNTKGITTKPTLLKGTPKYSTVLPVGKNVNDLGGWTRVSPPSSDPVFAYTDKIGNLSVIVSQQPLPANFKSDTDKQVEQLAQGFNANAKISVGSTVVYIGTSAKGPQSVFFSKNGLLILIKSSEVISNDEWAKYISSLQ
jgi:hypothetical protein